MMKDFKQTTEQLRELAKVLNEFKSETVQIKLIELLFNKNFVISTDTPESPVKEIITETKIEEKQVEEQTTEPEVNVEEKPVKVAKPKQAKVAAPPVKVIRKRSTTRPGPSIILKTLIDSNFFSDNRTIGDVVDYCMKMYNFEYKSTDLSGTLAKLSKDGLLRREKNPLTNQFEYTKV